MTLYKLLCNGNVYKYTHTYIHRHRYMYIHIGTSGGVTVSKIV